MKILIISPTFSGIGGVAQHVSKLVKKLIERNFEVEVLACGKVGCLRKKGLANLSFIALSSLMLISKRKSYDVVHAHNIPSAFAMRVVSGRRVLTLHGVFSDQISFLYGRGLGHLARAVERVALGWADAITAVSRDVTEKYRRMGFSVNHVPNAIDLRDLPREAVRLYDRQVVYVGRLSKEKGVLDLVKAFLLHDVDADLLIVGDGPLRPLVDKLSARSPRIHVLGYRPRSEALKLLKGSDVFVLPSYHEGLSTALLEAMALRVPCVATRVGGNVELLEGGAGLLVEPGRPAELAERIRELLSDRRLAENLARTAYDRVVSRYNWDVVFQQYLDVYLKSPL
ncbi:glycosyltransferase family 4 protein [Infirmifilum lucidum]|uniref:Glycosyltransferase family 4 protein n=1 Tax=Infirmifilum lucidum TaxID=2776706 RepID=A0A7L9FIX8_9CREN|nr:glycosyltransferase family 4 protein [Infirmifilum lucidum]